MKMLMAAAVVILTAGVASAGERVFTQDDLENYQRGSSASDSSRGRSADSYSSSQKADSSWEKKKSEEERRKLLSDCLQQQDQEHKDEWDRICRSDNMPPGCLLASYKRYELQDRRDDGKRSCRRQYGY